jgi:hypothetical protein
VDLPRRQTPEERYLEKKRGELSALESQLAEHELELHTVRGTLIAFEKNYEAVVSDRYAQLEELHMKIAELTAPPAFVQMKQRYEALCGAAADRAKAQTTGWRRPPRNAPAAAATSAERQEQVAAFNPPESLKRLYRDVAKSIHPDLADSDENRAHRHRFMVRANEAYETGDEQRLLAIFQEWDAAPESVKGVDTAADLVRVIRKIAAAEERMVRIADEVQQLQTSGLFGMKMMADEAAQFERDLLAEMTGRLDEEIEAARAYLAKLEKKLATDGHR